MYLHTHQKKFVLYCIRVVFQMLSMICMYDMYEDLSRRMEPIPDGCSVDYIFQLYIETKGIVYVGIAFIRRGQMTQHRQKKKAPKKPMLHFHLRVVSCIKK